MHVRRSVRPASALAGLLLAAALALTGCSAGGGDSSSDKAAAGSAAGGAYRGDAKSGTGSGGGSAAESAKATAAPKLTTAHIVRTASLSVEVKDVAKALDAARTAVENAGGYVGDENTTRDEDGQEQTRVVLRVPADRYDDVLTGLQGAGRLLERTAKAEDVTDQVVDVDSRITSQRASVARVRALMERAERIDDVVALESELSRREADLESLLAQQASLKDRTSLATITLSLSGPAVHRDDAAPDDEPGFGDALSGGWHVFVAGVRWIALVLGAVLPFAVAAALIVVAWRLVRRRLPRRAAAAAVPAMTAVGPLPGARQGAAPARPTPPVHPAAPTAPATATAPVSSGAAEPPSAPAAAEGPDGRAAEGPQSGPADEVRAGRPDGEQAGRPERE
ncbi:DUF4349 domain-containing protein [Streptomyces sennicomposti]|uniref:DUF4349 domain-containing protein n=1 Tax=Streptomyces sennicomposti TaxID=2873384 RepID=UPI001CA655CD|nr:DUF4349 domain-containing protein [Streptomyces sennicomposti]MBY8866770.1 DUF4349 domain-containing protein [Streptomyces sennicomposti]